MASDVSICSQALLMLGADPISSLSEDESDNAKLCANLWPLVRDAVLRAGTWHCATKRVRLAPLVDAPAFDYAYQFVLPSDWLRTLRVGEYGQEPDYRMAGGRVLCDMASLPLLYVFRNEDPASYDSLLMDAMVHAMAARLAYPVTESSSEAARLRAEFERLMRQARAVDGQEDPPETLGDESLYGAGFTGR